MGMFDDLYFEKSPMVENPEVLEFQTKSLDNALENYRITEDNILQVSEYKLRDAKPEEQTDIKGAKFPLWIKEHQRWGNTDITGTLEVHTSQMVYVFFQFLTIESSLYGFAKLNWVRLKFRYQIGSHPCRREMRPHNI